MKDKIIQAGQVQLFTQSFGRPEDPPILLIAGATVSMLFWEAEFCEALAEKGYFVIRYDFRDTGKSTTYPAGELHYGLEDLSLDIVHILDSYGIEKAHLLGISLGGMLAQITAITHPERIASLTLFATMPWADSPIPVPEMDPSILEFHAAGAQVNWENEEQVVEHMLKGSRLMSGNKPLDEDRAERYIRESFHRAIHFPSQFNHAQLSGAESTYNQIEKIKAPVLVIHGSDDKICHFHNALALMQLLKPKNLVVLEGTGHELHAQDYDQIIAAVDRLIQASKQLG